MRRLAILTASMVGTWMPVCVQAQTDALRAGMQSLFLTAEKHNATLKSMQAAIKEAEAGTESAKTARMPEIEGSVSVSYLGNGRIWNRHFGESTSAPMPHFGNNFYLKASQLIYAGGAVDAGIRLSEQNAQMTHLTAEDERQKVRFLLAGLYLQLHSLCNAQNVYRTNAALANDQIALMRKRREQGVSLRNDITRYELQLEEMNLGISTSEDQMSIVRRQLLTALGTDSATFALLDESAFDENAVAAQIESRWQQTAADGHIALQKAQLGVDISRTKETLEKAERRPKVALVAEDHLDGPITIEVPAIDKNFNYWFVGVGVTYNFSSLYKNKRKINQARLATNLAETRQDVAREEIRDAVHAAYVGLNTARTELATRKKSVQLASENYDVVSKRYQNGLAIVTDLTDAANIKLDAELALVNARINLLYAYYKLKYISGNI